MLLLVTWWQKIPCSLAHGVRAFGENERKASYDEEKLVIDGSPASMLSKNQGITGTANQFIIYPNLSMEMLGDAQLLQNDQSIYAEQITYKISPND